MTASGSITMDIDGLALTLGVSASSEACRRLAQAGADVHASELLEAGDF